MIALALVMHLATAQSEAPISAVARGSTLYHQCQAAIRVQDRSGVIPADYPLSGTCLGYIDGFLDGLMMAGKDVVCYSGATLGTMARVYVLYMNKHPTLFDEDKSIGLTNALLEQYPCKTGSTKK